MDPLSDVLQAVHLDGAYFYHVEASAPWSVAAHGARELVPRILPGVDHLISYHILLSGSCWGGLLGEEQVRLAPGDAIVFPHGDPHMMSSAAGRQAHHEDQHSAAARYPDVVKIGAAGARDTTFVCGFLGCDARPFNPLVASLPRVLHVPGLAGGWLSEFPRQVVAESRRARAGAATMLTRMAELMFVEVVRRHLEQGPATHAGWLMGLRDPVVGPALVALHERPADPWTLPSLARAIASSRTVLAERFTQAVGVPPMQYLTKWRLQLAAGQLAKGSAKVASIAGRVGYASEAAFSRAFKRETGVSPADWRRARASGEG